MEEEIELIREDGNIYKNKILEILKIMGIITVISIILLLVEDGEIACFIFMDILQIPCDDFFVICILTIPIIITIMLSIFWFYISKMEITVTNTRVYGKAAFGKRVDLPFDSISAVGTSFLKGIDIGTSSGRIHFKGIMNNNEIHAEISKLLNNRQSEKQVKENITSTTEELKKYKDLLDNGVITQEDFDAKKKQLLGL